MTFESDLQRWKTAGATLVGHWGETRDMQQGVGEREKPEDPGYLLLLAAPRTKRGLNTFFLFDCKQKRGFESTHDSHGNGFRVPTIVWH